MLEDFHFGLRGLNRYWQAPARREHGLVPRFAIRNGSEHVSTVPPEGPRSDRRNFQRRADRHC
jgi:hypothetical protein